MATLDFNANDVAPSAGFEPLPAGEYPAVVTDSEMKPTKAGNGTLLQLVFQVVDGPSKGRKLWHRINYANANATAQQIGRADLSALCRAVGVMTPHDTAELHNRPVTVKVGFEKRQDTGEIQNKVLGYVTAGGNVAGAVVAGTSKPAGAVPPPWAAKSPPVAQ